MIKRILPAFVACTFVLSAAATAQMNMKAPATATPAPPPDKPATSEVAFVTSVSKDLQARFPTTADAEKAGYFRY
ncbi:MAG: hypothetical protein JOZ38_00400, partial [Candidatus Eremiobacteraeota bacterium]|nr:hypothetical protein [Candidatus Eremiobacteraeota bacterium]